MDELAQLIARQARDMRWNSVSDCRWHGDTYYRAAPYARHGWVCGRCEVGRVKDWRHRNAERRRVYMRKYMQEYRKR